MNCHACKAPMELDRWGHPVHQGLCPGYPVRRPDPTVVCGFCGSTMKVGNLTQHHRRCTLEHPKEPAPQSARSRVCPVCHLPHRRGVPVCQREAPRWPLEPLLAVLGVVGPEGAAKRLGVNAQTFADWLYLGMTDTSADRYACRAGFHPALIWPGWFDAGITPLDAVKAERRAWRHMWLQDQTQSQQQEQAA